MRIVSVKFLNLNSLKGEQEIRFDRPPFTESGLFAITGPTGAGKTTILDAITVALYGRVHRHNKDVSEMMSRHTAECFSEVEFEVKAKLYRAKWSLRRSRGKVNGALQAYKMELAEVSTGAFLGGHTLTSVQQAIIELCGLDFNQFLRSVILSQGDFTRFLKADESERSDLLEKITDTGIYSEISRFAFERSKEEREKLDSLRSRLNDVELLSETDRTAHEDRLNELSAEVKALKEEYGLIVVKIGWLTGLHNLREKKVKLLRDLSEQQSLLEVNKDKFSRLMLHKQASEFKPALVEIRTLQDHANSLKVDLKKMQLQIPSIKNTTEDAQRQFAIIKIEENRSQKELSEAKPLLEKVIQLDSEIEGLKSQCNRLNLVFQKTTEEVNSLIKKEEEKVADLEKLELTLSRLQSWLNENKQDGTLANQLIVFKQYNKQIHDILIALEAAGRELSKYQKQESDDKEFVSDNAKNIEQLKIEIQRCESEIEDLFEKLKVDFAGKTLEELESEAATLPSLMSYCEQQYKLSKSFAVFQESKKDLLAQIKDQKNVYAQQEIALQHIQNEKEAAEANLSDLRQLVELQQRIQKYEADRDHLKPQHPCPLCGSLDHPYVLNHYKSSLSEAERKRNEQEKLVETLTIAFNKKVLDLNSLKLTIASLEEKSTKLNQDISDNLEEFNGINELLPKELDIEKTETIYAVFQKKRVQYEVLQKDIRSLREVQQKINSSQKLLSERREVLIHAQSKSDSVLERIEALREQADRVSKVIEGHKESYLLVVSSVTELLSPFQIEYDQLHAQQIETVLAKRSEKYEKCLNDLQALSLKHTQIKTEIKSVGEALAEKLSLMLKQEAELKQEKEKQQKVESERTVLFGDINPSHEWERLNEEVLKYREQSQAAQEILHQRQEQLKVAESRIAQLDRETDNSRRRIQQVTEQLTAQIQEKQIASIEALKQLFLPEEDANEIAELEKIINTRLTTLNQLIDTTEDELQSETAKDLTTLSIEELDPKADDIDLAVSKLNQEIGRYNRVLEEDNLLKLRFAEVTREIEKQQKEYAKWHNLSALIGSADGKKFSRFAQGLTLARLTDLANRHLQKLSDRYQILKSKEKDLELQIIDGYQADVVRPMATLSGGESFLVSLALALGLSDLASRKVQINSLFIDEGFGTLDSDTLDIAISALENLQAKGKSIGIISHVDALKERIGTQIQVSKQPGGSSRIKVFGYTKEIFGDQQDIKQRANRLL